MGGGGGLDVTALDGHMHRGTSKCRQRLQADVVFVVAFGGHGNMLCCV
jgi:hypothetical protein